MIYCKGQKENVPSVKITHQTTWGKIGSNPRLTQRNINRASSRAELNRVLKNGK